MSQEYPGQQPPQEPYQPQKYNQNEPLPNDLSAAMPPGYQQPFNPPSGQPSMPPGYQQPFNPPSGQPSMPPGYQQPFNPPSGQPLMPPGYSQPLNPQQGPYPMPPGYSQPFNPQQGSYPMPPGYQQPYNGQYGQQASKIQKLKKRHSLKASWNSGPVGKCGVIALVILLLLVVGTCSGIMNAVNAGSQVAANQTQAVTDATDVPTAADTAIPEPTATPEPPTATPKPTESPAQIEADYKASTTDATIVNIDKSGSADTGKEDHFTCTIVDFVKDSTGITVGANVTDISSSSDIFVQVIFTPGTDITQMNTGDILEVWGTNQGSSSGTNAYGGIVQGVDVQAKYMSDQTTGYKADS